jgi:zeaxanthin glucosyltransferase
VNVNEWKNNVVARFLFVILPVTSHLNPAVAIARELIENGHDVAWCGPESDLRPLVGPTAAVYPTGKRAYRQYAESGMAAARVLWDGYLIPVNRFIMAAADRAVAEDRPDVVVADQYALAGALAALRHGTRWASLVTGAMELTPPAQELPDLAACVRAQLARAWAMTDLPADESIDLRFSPCLTIALTTTALTGGAPLPASCVLTGPALGRRPPVPGFTWDGWDPGRRHVLVTVGTASEHMASDFYARTVQALEPMSGRLQPLLVASADLIRAPRHALTAPRVPMLDVLPRLDAVICHGGMGTVTEALAHGVPLVLAPIRHDQPVVARQVAEAGAGVEVGFESATAADIADAVSAVLDEPGYRANARRIGDSFAAAGGARAAAAHLAAFAARGPASAAEDDDG